MLLQAEHMQKITQNGWTTVIATTIDKDLIVRTPRMEIVWEPWFIIDKRYLDQMLTSLMLQDDWL